MIMIAILTCPLGNLFRWKAVLSRVLGKPSLIRVDGKSSFSTASEGVRRRTRAKLVNGRAMATEILDEVFQ